jgi:hypothetical protein
MPYLLAALGIAILVYFVVKFVVELVFLAIKYVVVPLVLLGVGVGVVAGLALGLACAARVVFGRYQKARLRTPDIEIRHQLRGRAQRRYVRRDRAWSSYLWFQVWLDMGDMSWLTCESLWRCWRWYFGHLHHDRPGLLDRNPDREARPGQRRQGNAVVVSVVVVVPTLLGITAGALAVVAVYGLVTVVAVVVVGLGALALVALMRSADRAWQRLYRASGSCPVCYEVTPTPAYKCPGNHPGSVGTPERYDLHRDLRPGRLGVLWRDCACGRLLPTMVQRAGLVLQPICPHCLAPMHRGAGSARDIRMPVFGATRAGKTHLIGAGMVSLVRQYDAGGTPMEPAEGDSKQEFDQLTDIVDGRLALDRTLPNRKPVAMTFRLDVPTGGSPRARAVRRARRGRGSLVHIFDASGETYVDPRQGAELTFLDLAPNLVFVLDPFSVVRICDTFGPAHPDVFAEANAATHDPEDSYRSTVTRLRLGGVRTSRKRLAFVVSKADLLVRLPGAADIRPDSDAVRGWLHRWGLSTLAVSAERDFGQVRFFLTSVYPVTTPDQPRWNGASEPFGWILTGEATGTT